MNLKTDEPVVAKKYMLAPSREKLTAPEIIDRCLSGKLDLKSTYFVSDTAFAEIGPLSRIPEFAEAIAKFEVEKSIKDKRIAAECSPDKSLPLQIRASPESSPVGPYLPDQIRYLFSIGEFTASAEFKHPDYDQWFPCLSLFKGQWSHPLLNGSVAISQEVKKLSEQVTVLVKEASRIKWATRSAALFLILIFYCGIRIVLRIQQ